MSLFSLRKSLSQPQPAQAAPVDAPIPKSSQAHPLDALTGGALSAPTSGERVSRVRQWLDTQPTLEQINEVFKELSHRDRGAAKVLKEKIDQARREKSQEQVCAEWARKAQVLLEQPRLNLADALAWQRDAARAGAPLSRQPLADLKQALAERTKALENLQHRLRVENEAAMLMTQRIEVLSVKPWREAQEHAQSLRADVLGWQQQAQSLTQDPQWSGLEVKFPPMLETARTQLQLVWEAFDAALAQAVAADADPQAPLPAVPVWANELRAARHAETTGSTPNNPEDELAHEQKRTAAAAELSPAIGALEHELAQGHGKTIPKAAAELRALLKAHARWTAPDIEARAHAVLAQAGELEGWQRWRADQLRQELLAQAQALLEALPEQRLGGRKMQETLRSLREQWKTTDQGGMPNHNLWKRFDEACNEAHKVVEAWLAHVRLQAEAHKVQRLALIEQVHAWTAQHEQHTDWRAQMRDLHAFSEQWRQAGHLSEKAFHEIQALWRQAMRAAHARLEAAQAQSAEQRQALIAQAQTLGSAAELNIDEIKALQQRWQAQAQAVPLDRKLEQTLWEAFRAPIDEAFARKSAERQKAAAALNAHDQRVLDACAQLQAASAGDDAQKIRAAMATLELALKGQAPAPSLEPMVVSPPAPSEAASSPEAVSPASPDAESVDQSAAPEVTAAQPVAAPAKKIVAVRGDDRPGLKPSDPPARTNRRETARPGTGAAMSGRQADARFEREPWGPRLGDAAFRAQRQAVELAQNALRKLAAQTQAEVFTQLLSAWQARDPQQLPQAKALGPRLLPPVRVAWAAALAQPASGDAHGTALLRLEIAAQQPTPLAYLSQRRMLQLQLLTQRHAASPEQTWGQDAAQVLASAFEPGAARRLQNALATLLKTAH